MSSEVATRAAPMPVGVAEVLDEFARCTGRSARVAIREGDHWLTLADRAGPREPLASAPYAEAEAEDGGALAVRVELCADDDGTGDALARMLAASVLRALKHDAELRSISREIAERYEEITLLYSISEILGSVISLDAAAETILEEVTSILGARRAALWIHDGDQAVLRLVAAVGGDGQKGPIPVADPCSLTAQVFRDRRPLLLAPGQELPRDACDTLHSVGALLSVPVSYTPPEGTTRTIGVINLLGRDSDDTYSAGDVKLLSAIASQIGAAVENNRLIEESLTQERLVREMELAHDLQLKLLPPLEQFQGLADVAGRCVPAESVGGDFYHLFRLSGGRLGVVIGDVSSHGFGAALIMALTMSAVAIHASEGDPPAEVLRRVHETLIDELETTEMYLTLFYGVLDPTAGQITFANAGHPHAFRVAGDGAVERLASTDPPLGIADLSSYHEDTRAWRPGEDLLFLYTDGLSDAVSAGHANGEDVLLEAVRNARGVPLPAVIEALFAIPGAAGEVPPDDRTALLVRA